jgi:hypothetical protein
MKYLNYTNTTGWSPWRWWQYGPLKRWQTQTSLHGAKNPEDSHLQHIQCKKQTSFGLFYRHRLCCHQSVPTACTKLKAMSKSNSDAPNKWPVFFSVKWLNTWQRRRGLSEHLVYSMELYTGIAFPSAKKSSLAWVSVVVYRWKTANALLKTVAGPSSAMVMEAGGVSV